MNFGATILRMRRFIACLLIAVLGTMPLVGMARMASADMQGAQDMQEMPCHESAPKAAAGSTDDCGSCAGASHCCASLILPTFVSIARVDAGAIRISGGQDLPAGVIVTPLDPPPLTR